MRVNGKRLDRNKDLVLRDIAEDIDPRSAAVCPQLDSCDRSDIQSSLKPPNQALATEQLR